MSKYEITFFNEDVKVKTVNMDSFYIRGDGMILVDPVTDLCIAVDSRGPWTHMQVTLLKNNRPSITTKKFTLNDGDVLTGTADDGDVFDAGWLVKSTDKGIVPLIPEGLHMHAYENPKEESKLRVEYVQDFRKKCNAQIKHFILNSCAHTTNEKIEMQVLFKVAEFIYWIKRMLS